MKLLIENSSHDVKKTNDQNNYFFGNRNILIYNKDNISYDRIQMSTFLRKSQKEKELELLKYEVKQRLRKSDILFTDLSFCILIDIKFRRIILFSNDPVGYKIYTESGFELGCSTDHFMLKDDPFEALEWTIVEILAGSHKLISWYSLEDVKEVA